MKLLRAITLSALAVFMLGSLGSAQDRIRRVEATALGQGNQAGMSIGITVTLDGYSSDQDRRGIFEAFQSGGEAGLDKAIVSLPARGHLSFAGVADYEIAYVRVFATEKGRKLRLVARRPLAFGETRRYQNVDYLLAALELDLPADSRPATGVFIPACELSIKQDKEIEVLTYTSAWQLSGITIATR